MIKYTRELNFKFFMWPDFEMYKKIDNPVLFVHRFLQ